MSIDRTALVHAWADARWSEARLKRRPDLERRQQRLWRRLEPTLRRTPALAHLAGRPLDEFPVVTPGDIRADFEQWNTLGLTLAEAERAAEASERDEASEIRAGVAIGYSTGTSGGRGLFVSTPEERGRYLGHALARLLSASALLRGVRIALCLRAGNRLYSDVSETGRVRFRYFGLDFDKAALELFDPQVLIAPSHVLADLARSAEGLPRLRPERLFYGAESMGDAERAWIEKRLGARPDPIYQATEGFLGCACRLGTLHLNEDVLVVELVPTRAAGCFQPVVTDLRRTTQPMVRVLLDDLTEPLETPCLCGSPRRAVRGVAGRVSDLWIWGDAVITPREVTEAIEAALPPGARWMAEASSHRVRVEAEGGHGEPAVAAVSHLLQSRGVGAEVAADPFAKPEAPKRRRVRWRDD